MDIATRTVEYRHGDVALAPTANNPEAGVAYDAVTARRAWGAMTTFLAEALS